MEEEGEYKLYFQIDNHVYICPDVDNIADQEFITLMNSHLLTFGKYGHNLTVLGDISCINSFNTKPYLPELSTQKVREYLNLIENTSFEDNTNTKTNNEYDTESDDELYFNSTKQSHKHQKNRVFSEIVGIDGETVYYESLQFD